MRAVIQRCGYASVNVEGKMVAEIGKGILALVGFGPQDTEKDIDYVIDKTVNLRIFSDENDKMNLSVKDVGGSIIFVPNFTLYGDARHGRRPGYSYAAEPKRAEELFELLKEKTVGMLLLLMIFQELVFLVIEWKGERIEKRRRKQI